MKFDEMGDLSILEDIGPFHLYMEQSAEVPEKIFLGEYVAIDGKIVMSKDGVPIQIDNHEGDK